MSKTMPVQKPGKSVQDVGTPEWLLRLIESTWGAIALDPCASHENHALDALYYTKEQDGLTQSWNTPTGTCVFVNPPYEDIRPWVKKAQETAYFWSNTVVVLVPASVGSNWWKDEVHMKAAVYFLSPRLKFKGHSNGFPKDLALLVFGAGPPVYRCIRATERDTELMFKEPASGHAN